MKRILIFVFLLSALLCPQAEAGPKKVIGKIAEVTLDALAAGSSVESDRQIDLCRVRAGIEHCNGGYGEVTGRQALNGVLVTGAILMSRFAHHQGWRDWSLPTIAVTAYNGITAYKQAKIPPERYNELSPSSFFRKR